MSNLLPPVPLQDIKLMPYTLQEWFRQVRNILTGVAGGVIPWASVDKTGSNLADLVTRNHNDLQNKQGGTSSEYYHLTSAEYSGLTNVLNPSQVALTAQSASIAATTILTPATNGQYQIGVYAVCTTAGSAGTLKTTLTWTDDGAARTQNPIGDIDLSATNYAQNVVYLRCKTTAALKYSTTVTGATGSPRYALFITVTRIS